MKKTDWNKANSRDLLYNAMRDKLKSLLEEAGSARRRPDSWVEFLRSNRVGAWGRASSFDPHDLRYKYTDHVWISSPDGELAEDDWDGGDEYFQVLFVPYEFAEKMVKALMLGAAKSV